MTNDWVKKRFWNIFYPDPKTQNNGNKKKKMTGRKQRAKNWTSEETEKMLDLRFNNEIIVHKFKTIREKKDENDVWALIGKELGTDHDGTQCKDCLKTLLATYKVKF